MNVQTTAVPVTDDYDIEIVKYFSIMAVVYGLSLIHI